MCTTFLVRCMCGHEFYRKVVRCAQAIRSQLGLAETDIDEGSITIRNGCVCEVVLPEEYLKPDICEQCKTKGLIGDYLNNDPSVKFEIIKEWLAQKRARRTTQTGEDLSDHADLMEKLEFSASSSVSSVISGHPKTPTSGSQSSYVCTSGVDHTCDKAGLTLLSSASDCFAKTLSSRETDVDHMRFEAEDEGEPNLVSRHTRNLDGAHNLGRRVTALKEKLHFLVAENKQRRACDMQDCTGVHGVSHLLQFLCLGAPANSRDEI